jgi:hypothetical protein
VYNSNASVIDRIFLKAGMNNIIIMIMSICYLLLSIVALQEKERKYLMSTMKSEIKDNIDQTFITCHDGR